MPRKVIIDCDPGIDDAIALTMALFDPRLEVLAVTAVAGNVSAEQATRNVQAIIEQLDPPRYPRLGAASEGLAMVDNRQLFGEDGLGNAGFVSSQLARQHPAEKLICDEVRAAPGEVTLVCLGPLTNIAAALAREPQLISMLGRLVIMGGSVNGVGNVTSAAEYNIYFDPHSARQVFRSPTTKTLIPLDVTTQVTWSLDLLDQLPAETTRAGNLLRKTLPFLFRTYRREMGLEGIHLHDAVAMAAVVHPELFTTRDMTGDVETAGELTLGATVFDRRGIAHNRGDMEVAMEVDAAGVSDCVVRALQDAGRQT
ncbi:nucleoside hydrolase [Anatilimnocola floriformis]|uniref:nucleoside hydrolase n=1 Tax=Anatilimnocola floriformis TaxID=2948575 RepID=UPI0020C43BCF|nr:nucleoside hydrolase [Anatilimnocola floriformis]